MIVQESITRVIDTAVVEEVVGDYVDLKRRGVNLLGLCPFHDEKTPSFTVSPAKGIYKCFGCGKAGNSVSFIMDYEQLAFTDAIRFLGKKYNIEIIETENTAKEQEHIDTKATYQIVMDFAQNYFSEVLHNSEDGVAFGLSYFKERGLKTDTIKEWQLGFSKNDWHQLTEEAEKKGFKFDDLEATGLIKRNDKDQWYDIFRDRVIFPIHNAQGKIVAFAGRVLKKDEKTAKYLNSPETVLYKKSKILYGLHKAKNEIRKQDKCYLVEGYLDVITLHQEGIANVVAASGTAFTEEQARLVKRFTPNMTVIFDGDAAGMKAAFRSIDILLTFGFNVRVIAMPEGEDPDSLCQKLGSDKFKHFLDKEEKDFILYKSQLLMQESANDPIRKSEFVQDILKSIALISDSIQRSFYIKECGQLMQIDEEILHKEMRNLLNKKKTFKPLDISEKKEQPKQFSIQQLEKEGIQEQEKALIKTLLNYGNQAFSEELKVADFIIQQLTEDETIFTHEIARQIYEIYIQEHSKGNYLDSNFFVHQENHDIMPFIADLMVEHYELSNGWEKNDVLVITQDINYTKETLSIIYHYKFKRANQLLFYTTDMLKEEVNEEQETVLLQEYQIAYNIKKTIAGLLGNIVG